MQPRRYVAQVPIGALFFYSWISGREHRVYFAAQNRVYFTAQICRAATENASDVSPGGSKIDKDAEAPLASASAFKIAPVH